jgi:Delta7-sterol 5-desaturase
MNVSWQTLERAIFFAIPGHFSNEVFWYLTFATSIWVLFYWVFFHWMKRRRISDRKLESRRVAWEVIYSFRSMGLFGFTAGLVAIAVLSGWTRLYIRIDDYGWTWLVLSVVVLIFAHDTYFYWTHRAMHHPWLFRRVHRIHHLSTNPTPWAAYSFSVPEAFVQAGVVPLMILLVPLHPLAIFAFGIYRHFFSVLGHSGYEIFPKWFMRTPLAYFFNTNTHHHQHHEVFNANYGLYFNFWDRIMGTNHERYAERFEEVVNRLPSQAKPAAAPASSYAQQSGAPAAV